MAVPSAYTETELKQFMVTALGHIAPVLTWTVDTAQIGEAINDTLLEYGVNDIEDATDIKKLRALAKFTVWQAAQEAAMFDECVIVEMQDMATNLATNAPVTAPVDILTTSCGFRPAPRREVGGGTQVVAEAASVRLPLAVQESLKPSSRIRITKRFGAAAQRGGRSAGCLWCPLCDLARVDAVLLI